jgi:hypothetical protein
MENITNKLELRKYLESNSNEVGIRYCVDWLKKRKQEKNIEYQLSEFECKSLCFPSILYIEKRFGIGSYNKITEMANLKLRYSYKDNIKYDNEELEIICDTREQNLLSFKNIQIEKLDYGDYYCHNGNNPVSIERKSLVDLVGTISQGYNRFKKEIERCKADNNYLIVIIEEKYNHLLSFSYLPHMKMVRASETFILHRIRSLIQEYPFTIQFLSVDGRKESSRAIEKIFNIKDNIQTIDLQWLYNKKIL